MTSWINVIFDHTKRNEMDRVGRRQKWDTKFRWNFSGKTCRLKRRIRKYTRRCEDIIKMSVTGIEREVMNSIHLVQNKDLIRHVFWTKQHVFWTKWHVFWTKKARVLIKTTRVLNKMTCGLNKTARILNKTARVLNKIMRISDFQERIKVSCILIDGTDSSENQSATIVKIITPKQAPTPSPFFALKPEWLTYPKSDNLEALLDSFEIQFHTVNYMLDWQWPKWSRRCIGHTLVFSGFLTRYF